MHFKPLMCRKWQNQSRNFIVPHFLSSSGGSLCKWRRCNSARERHKPSCSSNIPPVPLQPPGPPGQLAVMSHSHGTERGHQGHEMTERRKPEKRWQEGIEQKSEKVGTKQALVITQDIESALLLKWREEKRICWVNRNGHESFILMHTESSGFVKALYTRQGNNVSSLQGYWNTAQDSDFGF